jgi:hypothetical protein
MKHSTWIPVVVGVLAIAAAAQHGDRCMSTRINYGLSLPTCPDGKLQQIGKIEATNLRRGALGDVALQAIAQYTTHDSDSVESATIPKLKDIALTLIDAKNVATPLPADGWIASYGWTRAKLKLPDVPDGDYRLHAAFDTGAGHLDLEVALPLYTPARVHVITDRPLYEPGNTVRFRAVVLNARDLAPLDGRPGRWIVKNPSGEVLLEEKAPAGDWGIVAGTFPLDHAAPTGQWHIAWESADASDDVAFTVEPFTLPRFRVDATADKAFYQPGDKPAIKGSVVYSSGAPVANAGVDITWDISGDWPPPVEWQRSLLPKKAVTGATGRFELALPQVPADLQGKATLTAQISAIDPAGDRVAGAASVLLSADGISAQAVTELGDGLVAGFNNRMYVRVTTPDGRVVPGAKVKIKRAWQASDPGLDAELDEDGVASMQIDPGAPVNIVIPAKPWRPAARPVLVRRGDPQELIGAEGAPLADQVEMDKWLEPLAACTKWVDSETPLRVGLRVDAAGGVAMASAGDSALGRCVAAIVKQRRLPAGGERMYALPMVFEDPDLPKLHPSVESALDKPAGLDGLVDAAAKSTRDCLPTLATDERLPSALGWRVQAGSKQVELGAWVKDPKANALAAGAMACVTSRIAGRLELADKATADGLGLVRFTLEPPALMKQTKPQPTTMLGYELLVSADVEGKPSTKLRVVPGEVPALRMRVTPILAKPGELVTAELIRGPSFHGQLPKELTVHCLKYEKKEKLDDEHRAKLAIDGKVEGWCEITGGDTRALVYVRPAAELAVAVTPDKGRYAPGDKAQLAVKTLVGGKGSKAAVGLIGVDESLGQLVPLPGPGELGRIRPKVETTSPAFGVLDGHALTLGQIRGANAAAATVLRVGAIPKPPELDAVVNASGQSHFDPIEVLTDHFYNVLAELHTQTRRWESDAPKGEKMMPATMARLWDKALEACEKRGERVDDAYGRRLRLSILPADLLALTDPQVVVVVGTRLPEDVENWGFWVGKEKP